MLLGLKDATQLTESSLIGINFVGWLMQEAQQIHASNKGCGDNSYLYVGLKRRSPTYGEFFNRYQFCRLGWCKKPNKSMLQTKDARITLTYVVGLKRRSPTYGEFFNRCQFCRLGWCKKPNKSALQTKDARTILIYIVGLERRSPIYGCFAFLMFSEVVGVWNLSLFFINQGIKPPIPTINRIMNIAK